MSDLRDDVRDLFAAITGREPDGLWSAPGRVRLLGAAGSAELSFAIDRRTIVAAGAREDAVLRAASTLTDQAIEIPLAELDAVKGQTGWADYPLGVAWALGRSGADLEAVPGVDLVIDSNVPVGASLGSSASLVSAVALALDHLWRLGMPSAELARAAHLAESGYAGASASASDLLTALVARRDGAVLVGAGLLEAAHVDLRLGAAGLAIVAIDTGSSSAWTAASPEDDEVLAAARVLREEGPTAFGPLLDAPRTSVPELDLAVETAHEHGALGARPVGGGTAIALLPLDAVSRLQVAIDGAFAEHGFATPEVHPVRPSDGATRDR